MSRGAVRTDRLWIVRCRRLGRPKEWSEWLHRTEAGARKRESALLAGKRQDVETISASIGEWETWTWG